MKKQETGSGFLNLRKTGISWPKRQLLQRKDGTTRRQGIQTFTLVQQIWQALLHSFRRRVSQVFCRKSSMMWRMIVMESKDQWRIRRISKRDKVLDTLFMHAYILCVITLQYMHTRKIRSFNDFILIFVKLLMETRLDVNWIDSKSADQWNSWIWEIRRWSHPFFHQ